MSWRSIITTIGGIVAAPFTGGASIPIAAAAGQAWEAAHAASEAKKSEQGAATQQSNVYAPYQQLGVGAASTLAGLLGIPVSQYTGPQTGTGINQAVPRTTGTIGGHLNRRLPQKTLVNPTASDALARGGMALPQEDTLARFLAARRARDEDEGLGRSRTSY